MPAPINTLKEALKKNELQCGLWLAMANATIAEVAGRAGFDWCLIDAEHGPNVLPQIHAQLQALAGTPAQPILRVPAGEDWILKQALDMGVQTIVVPMVNTAQQAADVAAACRYPAKGTRGIGATLARATHYGQITDYVETANDQICLFVQIESAEAVKNVEAIAAVDGVDGLFVGPADLSADMGYPGQLNHPKVLEAIAHVYDVARDTGRFAGTITFVADEYQGLVDQGVRLLGMGADSTTLSGALGAVAQARPKA